MGDCLGDVYSNSFMNRPFLSVLLVLLAFVSSAAAQRIYVESAYYGTRHRGGTDVTEQVQRFARQGEPFRVSNELFGFDPAPTHQKTLVVGYVVDGRRYRTSAGEGDVFYFRGGGYAEEGSGPGYGPGPGPGYGDYEGRTRILRAVYGARGRYVDVTRIVREFVMSGEPFSASNETFGIDPYKGETKRLRISYIQDGERRESRWDEGALVSF
jgi:hypothetical protein